MGKGFPAAFLTISFKGETKPRGFLRLGDNAKFFALLLWSLVSPHDNAYNLRYLRSLKIWEGMPFFNSGTLSYYFAVSTLVCSISPQNLKVPSCTKPSASLGAP